MLYINSENALCAGRVSVSSIGALCIAVLTGALPFFPSIASADNSGWYVGADVGQSRFSGINSIQSPLSPSSFGTIDTGYRLDAGYSFDQYFAVEGGYVRLGEVTGSYTEPGIPPGGYTCGLICEQSYVLNADLKTRGWVLEAVGSYPFTDRWAIFGCVGGIWASSELSASFTPIPPYNHSLQGNYSDTSNDTDFTYGVGVRWSFAGNWAMRLSWNRYASLGHDLPVVGVDDFDVNLTSLGVVYQF